MTLGSVTLLLLNDHLLKRFYPSALTGKLSDFAGLFFFPYLVIALAGLAQLAFAALRPWVGLRCHGQAGPRWIAPVAFLGSGVLFAAVKASPPLSAAVSAQLTVLLRLPIRVTPDLTDLAALASLWPSYRLWRALERDRARAPSRRSLLALGLASLATAATSPCIPPAPLAELVATDHGLYALASWSTEGGGAERAYLSTDTGRTWAEVDAGDLPSVVIDAARAPSPVTRVACVLPRELICYRVAQQEHVEMSTDGGATWRISWSVASGRREYMARYVNLEGDCRDGLDLRAVDVAIVGAGPEQAVVVAIGNEGYLRSLPGMDEWTQIGFGYQRATPQRGSARDLIPPQIIRDETTTALLAGGLTFFVLSRLAWRRPHTGVTGSSGTWIDVPSWVVAGILILALVGGALVALLPNEPEWVLTVGILGIVGLLVMAYLLIRLIQLIYLNWAKSIRPAANPGPGRRLLTLTVAASILVVAAGWLPFALWVLGWIPPYGLAAVLSIGAVSGVVFLAVRRIKRASSDGDGLGPDESATEPRASPQS